MILMISSRQSYAAKRLADEAKRLNAPLEVLEAGSLRAENFNILKFSALYVRQAYPCFDEATALAKQFMAAGKYVVDASLLTGSINGFGRGKWPEYQQLLKSGLAIPKTVKLEDLDAKLLVQKFPLVLKWNYGFGGQNVFLVHDVEELKRLSQLHKSGEWLVQDYIPATKEYEIYVIGFKVVPKILAFNIQDGFKSNVSQWSLVEESSDPKKFFNLSALATRAALVTGRELCKVDILESGNQFYVLEVNRSPGLLSFESLLGYNMAEEFIKYIERQTMILKEKPGIPQPQQPPKPQA